MTEDKFKPGDVVIKKKYIDDEVHILFEVIEKKQGRIKCVWYYTCRAFDGSRYTSITNLTEEKYINIRDIPHLSEKYVEYLI